MNYNAEELATSATNKVSKVSNQQGIILKLFLIFSKIDTEKISLIILVLLSIQVLMGTFLNALSHSDLIALYFGKTVIIRFLGYIGIVIGLIDIFCKSFVYRKQTILGTFVKRPWNGLFVILLFWEFLGIVIAKNKNLAFFGTTYRYEGYLSYLAYVGIFACAAQIKSEKYRKILLFVTSITSTLLACLTIMKEIAKCSFIMDRNGQVGAYSATFINSNHYGYYLCVSMIVIAGLFLIVKKTSLKVLLGGCFTINLFVLLYNKSLGPYIALFIGLIVLFVFSWIRDGFKKSWPVLILVGIFIVASVLINGHKMVNDLNLFAKQTGNLINVISSNDSSSEEIQQAVNKIGSSRGALWNKTIQIISEHPIFGVGTDNVQLYINDQIPHNEYLQICANNGIPGVLLYVSGLLTIFIYAIKNLKRISSGVLVSGMAVLVYCLSAFVGISIPIATYQLFFFLGLLEGWFKNKDEEKMINTTL